MMDILRKLVCVFFDHVPVGFTLQSCEIRPAGHVDVWCKRCHIDLPDISVDEVERPEGLGER